MPAISVGSVEVDVLPNTQQFRSRMQAAAVPAANSVGDEVGRIIGRHIAVQVAASIRTGVTNGGRTAQAPAARQGAQTGSAFGRGVKTAIAAALRDLPEIQLDANSTPAQREIAQIRAQLQTLNDLDLDVDIDAGEAMARINQLQARLQRLSASDVDVDIRLDTAAASSQLAAFQARLAQLDGDDVDVDVDADTGSAVAGLSALRAAALAFGPAILPVIPVVLAGLGAIAAAGVAAGAGLGAVALVAMPAFKQIGGVLQAQKAATDAAAQSTSNGAQAAQQAASRANQLASAQSAVTQAERNGAKQIAAAQAQVSQARKSAAQTAAQASQKAQEAARAVRDAEDDLADAQRDARRAQQDLTAARRTAALELEDLNNRLAGSVLSQRDAEIGLKEATAERDAVLKSATATELDKQKALLAYDQSVQRLKEQTLETGRLKEETKKANKAGVEGSDTVRTAQERVASAQESVTDKTRALSDAQAAQSRTTVQNASDIADAQQRVAEAQRGVGEAQVSAAESAASAQRQLQQAQQQTTGGVDQAAIAQAKYQAELAKLSPSARQTYNAFVDLRKVFGAWSKSLQPDVMPIFTRALVGMKNALPGLTPLVKGAAKAISGLQDRASAGLKKPWWKEFKADLDTSVGPAITGLGIAFGNIFKGMVGIIDAFLPRMDDISGSMQGVTRKFADWGTSLKGSPEFEKFLAYSSQMGPKVWEAVRKIAGALLSVGTALGPIGGISLQALTWLAEGVGWVADKAPWVVQGIYGIVTAMYAWRLAVLLWSAVQRVASGVMLAFNAISAAGPWGWIVLGIAAVVVAVVLLYNRFGWFRTGVQAAWAWIQSATLWLWNTVLKPVFTAIGAIVVWLWNTIIKPYIGFIVAYWKMVGQVIVWLWQKIVKPYIGFMVAYWRMVASVAMWLWKSIFAPVFKGIGAIISWWWTNVVKRYFGYVRGAIDVLGGVFKWLWQKVVKPVFNGISTVISGVWKNGIKPTFDVLKSAVGKIGDAFESARKAIKIAWDKISGIAAKPVRFVVNTVYQQGIRKVWNAVADAFGADPLPDMKFASGGVLPGYTPGKDVHRFTSPTGGRLALSGGEAIMRPEFTRAVGSGFVGTMNSIAKSRGAQGVKAALAPVFGGNPASQSFADGGIFGWIGGAANKVAGAGSAAWNKIKEGADWLKDTLAASARAGVKNVVDPLLKNFPGMDMGFGKMIRRIPTKIIDTLFGYGKKADKKGGGGGIGGPRIQAATKWARTQAGLRYQWAGNGNPSWDCSGFMSAIESVIRGQKPHRRWATMAFRGNTAPPGWVRNGASAFKVGITNAGVGHTAGTIGKTNVESRGGDGVVVGSRARGYNSSLFPDWYGFQPNKYDSGGYLQPGLNLAYNGTGRPEPVFTSSQANALMSAARQPQVVGGLQSGDKVTLVVPGAEFPAYIDGRANAQIGASQDRLIQALNAS